MLGMRVATVALRERPRMEELAETARKRAADLGRPVLVSITTEVSPEDPLALFARAMGSTHNRFFWSIPAAGVTIAGLGDAWSSEAVDANPFPRAAAAWSQLIAEAETQADPALPFSGPVAVSGFSFDPTRPANQDWDGFPQGTLLLPRIVLAQVGDRASLTLNGLVDAQSSSNSLAGQAARRLSEFIGGIWRNNRRPSRFELADTLPADAWQNMVAEAVDRIDAGTLQKVVLARTVQLSADRPLDVPAAIERLRRDYPDTFVFAVARGGRTFLGASPERLVSLRDGVVSASGLAGSAARGITPEADQRLGAELLASAKDRAEHDFVVQMILEELTALCQQVDAPAEPALMKMRNVQHLFTPISGKIQPGRTIFDLVERLHPTPAVGGRPRDQALDWIRRHEQLNRGWYAGPVGWVDARGDGEFAVALRSALTERDNALLYAGCGIVAGSDPETEYHESRLKLRPMLSALGSDDL
jgi:isochorismate synthase